MPPKPRQIPADVHGALSGFLVLLIKGMLDDDRWDWNVDRLSEGQWKAFRESILDPTHFRTTLAVFVNNVRVDEEGRVVNYVDARFRGFQYFRAFLAIPGYAWETISPPLQQWELEEPDWRTWEA